jgi:predicted RND superfamily exporter protein
VLDRFLRRYSESVYRQPWLIVIVGLVLAIAGGMLATKIELRSDFAELLPETAQSVIDLKEISSRMGGMGTLIIQVEGDNLKAMQRFADDLSAKLRTYPKESIRFVDHKIDERRDFLEAHKWLYLKVDELSELRDGLNDRISKEKLKATGMYIDLDGDEQDEGLDFEQKRKDYEKMTERFDKYIDGYLTDEDGKMLIVVIKTPGTATGVSDAKRIIASVEADVAALNPQSYDPSLSINLTGQLQTLVEEYYALRDDIVWVSNLCVGLVLLAVALYFRSVRRTIIVVISLLGGVATTFGLTYLHIGYLTPATAFLAAIVAGNGINFSIYFLARYMEERRNKRPAPEMLAATLKGTLTAVSTAALAAGASYISLMLADFRGFAQFGFIGGVGMVICLLFALTMNPALISIFERFWPFRDETEEQGQRGRVFAHLVTAIVTRSPKAVFTFSALLIVASAIMLAIFMRDPYEYNFRNLRNQISNTEGSGARSSVAENILGERSSPHVILADTLDQVPMIEAALKPYVADQPGADHGFIKNIRTVNTYLPGSEKDQKKKLSLLKDIRRIILKEKERNNFSYLNDDDRKLLEDLTPPAELAAVTMADLPDAFMREFIEDNGTRGTPIYVYMNDGMSVWNGKDLEKFASVVRSITLESGEEIRSSGHAVIFTDMLISIAKEGPRSTVMAFLFVTLVIILSFRNLRDIAVLTLSMSFGVLLMMGVGIAFGQKINFLNYIAIPIQFGIGVDYSVNLYNRYLEEGRGSLRKVLSHTGGAVMITSLTTVIGYGALWFSINGAINSFGTLANIGEFTCLLVAVFMLPAYLAIWRGGLDTKNNG